MVAISNNNSFLVMWHHRLGHLHYEVIKEMINSNMVIGLPNAIKPTPQCVKCILGKTNLAWFPNNLGSKS
jgi:hypothetical protein